MEELGVLTKLIEYAIKLGPSVAMAVKRAVEAFVEDNPELKTPPPPVNKKALDAKIDAAIAKKFKKKK